MAAQQAVTRVAVSAFAQRAAILNIMPVQAGVNAEPRPTPLQEVTPEPVLATSVQPAPESVVQAQVKKSFNLHIGASLRIPTENARTTIPSSAQAQQEQQPITTRREAFVDPFEGLPLRRFADRVGEYIMPAFQAMQDDMRKAKRVAKVDVPVPTVAASSIPHFLPFTRWAIKEKRIQNTLIADDPKNRKKARLSWYHPDDTMVPRDWFRGGLLADLKYYQPFAKGT